MKACRLGRNIFHRVYFWNNRCAIVFERKQRGEKKGTVKLNNEHVSKRLRQRRYDPIVWKTNVSEKKEEQEIGGEGEEESMKDGFYVWKQQELPGYKHRQLLQAGRLSLSGEW